MYHLPHVPRSSSVLLVALYTLVAFLGQAAEPFAPARVAVYFSPNGGATDAVVREVNAATQQILVQAYSFTSAPIAKALLEAHKRGVRVEVILDQSNHTDKYSAADFLANQGVPTNIRLYQGL